MSGTESELKDLLRRDIAEGRRKVNKLRRELADVEPRLAHSIRFFRSRFGEDPFPQTPSADSSEGSGARTKLTPRRIPRRRITHADYAAVAITETGKVGVPLKVSDVLSILRDAGYKPEDFPTRETIVSTVYRSPLFRKVGRGSFVLDDSYPMDEMPPIMRSAFSGTAGNTRAPGETLAGDDSEPVPEDD